MAKVRNSVTTIPLTHAETKLEFHLQKMNNEGWELMSVAVENVGLKEVFLMFWRKDTSEEESGKNPST